MNQYWMVPLGEISTTVMGQAPPGAACNTDGNGTIFVKAGEFGEREPVVREWTTKPLKMSRRGDVLVCVVGATAGKINLGIDSAIGRSVAAVRPEQSKLDTSYLYHFLATKVGELRARSQGLAQGVITREMLAELTLPLPQLDEQRRIAAILDKADALRQKRKRAIALLDSVIENAIDEAFEGEPTTMTLGDVFAVQGGLQLSASRQRLPIETPYLRVANVHRDRLELAEIKTMGVTQAELERTALQAGDVLFVEGHGNANEIGRCAVWDGSISGCSHQNHLIRARPMDDLADPVVMSRWLNSPSGRKHLLQRGKTTSGLNTISVSDVRATPIPSIATDKSLRLRAQIDASQGHKSMMQSQLSQMDAAFTSIQYRAFEGEL